MGFLRAVASLKGGLTEYVKAFQVFRFYWGQVGFKEPMVVSKFWQKPPRMQAQPGNTPIRTLELGRLVATPNALAQVSSDDMLEALKRHAAHDWGDVCPEDWQSNEHACSCGFRVLSVYRTAVGKKFWIITEADRSVTTVLMPEDY